MRVSASLFDSARMQIGKKCRCSNQSARSQLTILPRSFYERNSIDVAVDLVGKGLLFRTDSVVRSGRIVEVEAYRGMCDPASHAANGPTSRSAVMFGPGGYSYVYFIYGIHHCFNVTTERAGTGGAVLIRAVEPDQDADALEARGPGKLARWFGFDRSLSGVDLTIGPILLHEELEPPLRIACSARVGITKARNRRWRFFDPASVAVSASRASQLEVSWKQRHRLAREVERDV